MQEMRERANKRKREMDDDETDDLRFDDLEVSPRSTATGSHATRRFKVWRQNSKVRIRADSRLKHRPIFTHIRIEPSPFFYRHYKPSWQFAEPDPIIERYMSETGDKPPGCHPDQMCFMLPCDAAQMAHLKYFDRPPRARPTAGLAAWHQARRLVGALLDTDVKLQFPHAETLGDVPFKKGKYPGNEYRELGHRSREEAHPAATVDAELAWARLLSGEYVEPHCVRLGGRGKLVEEPRAMVEEAGKPKGRLILMLSQRDLLLLGNVEKLVTDLYRHPGYPISVGFGWYKGNVTQFMERLGPMAKFFCMDAEKYDASLDPWLVEEGVEMLRSLFHEGHHPRYNTYWDFVLESLLAAPIARDDGWLMHKVVGTTSGHSFNTIIQSICTLLVGYAAIFDLTPREQWDDIWSTIEMESLGDDNILGVPPWLKHMTASALADSVMKTSGINWKGDKSFSTSLPFDVYDDPLTCEDGEGFRGLQYLGKYFRALTPQEAESDKTIIIPYRPLVETFGRVLYPERRGEGLGRTYLRVLGNLLDAYGNPVTAGWLNRILDWLEPQMRDIPPTWHADLVQDIGKDYEAVEVQAPEIKRWSFEEWLRLTLVRDYLGVHNSVLVRL